jgi:L-alanine-DL-glutamate epimerase-like enolase superfamily enzyme
MLDIMTSKIVDIKIRACSGLDPSKKHQNDEGIAWVGGIRPDFTVVSITTSDGLVGTSFGFGALDSNAAAAAMSQVKPFFLGRSAHDSAKNIHDFEKFDRLWNHVPIYAYSPFDNACWDIVGKMAGQPVYKVLGAAREKVPLYVSSMFLPGPEDYVKQALEVKAKGYRGYKLHPPGEINIDIECYKAVRDAVGNDFTLMADPVIMDSYESALKVGRELEKLGYKWMEEPLNDMNFNGLRKLREKLDIPICGTEIIEGAQFSSAHYITEGIVDIVRSDVSWRGGITSVMRTAHMAEAFGVKCELHTTIYHALEQVNLHPSLAISNCEFFEALYPFDDFIFGTKSHLNIEDGYVLAPKGEGLCIDYDWDFIDKHTVRVY